MQLFGIVSSPFVACVVLYAAAKGTRLEPQWPEGGPGSPEFMHLNPFGKVPVLQDGAVTLFETPVICDYLEQRLDGPVMVVNDAVARAQAGMAFRAMELYALPPLPKLVMQLGQGDPREADRLIGEAARVFDVLERWLPCAPYAGDAAYSIADCFLMPLLVNYRELLGWLGRPTMLEGRPRLTHWWDVAIARREVAEVEADMRAVLPRARELLEARIAAARAGVA